MNVAEIILSQLGGHQFTVMTGAKNYVGGNDCLSFRIGRNAKNINVVRITLAPSDTYTVEFIKVRKFEYTTAVKVEDVYAENLREVFTANTGLYTSMRG